MKPIEQERYSPGDGGDCYAASIASVLEIPLSEVPRLDGSEGMTHEGYDAYRERLYTWLRERNLEPLFFSASQEWVPSGYSVLSVESPNFPGFEHAVVVLNGEVVWDPHPNRGKHEFGAKVGYTIFQALDPARVSVQ